MSIHRTDQRHITVKNTHSLSLLGALPMTVIPLQSALTDANFKTAVELWFSNQEQAIANFHGHISDWNVSEVTNMSEAFKDREFFNEDIETGILQRRLRLCTVCTTVQSPSIRILETGILLR